MRERIRLYKRSIQTIQQAAEFIKSVPVETKYNQAIKAIEQIVDSAGKSLPDEVRTNLINRIRSNNTLKVLLPKGYNFTDKVILSQQVAKEEDHSILCPRVIKERNPCVICLKT